MQDCQTRLLEFAESECLPYLSKLPRIARCVDKISFALVGSVATGLCSEDSDVDIALVCDKQTYEDISQGTPWSEGRPSEVSLSGNQLHFYGISFEKIEEGLRSLDDVYLYVYGNARVLSDPHGEYERRLASMLPDAPRVRKERLEGKLDMLLRRTEALKQSLGGEDPIVAASICLELITLVVNVAALLDNISFDPRKRLLKTALGGKLGRRIEPMVRDLFAPVGELGNPQLDLASAVCRFLERLETITQVLCEETRAQGYRVGLDHPDRRHIEK